MFPLMRSHRFENIPNSSRSSGSLHRDGNNVQWGVNLVAPVLHPEVEDGQAELAVS